METAVRAYFDDGSLRAEGEVKNGLLHGIHREWHANGMLAKEMPYQNGVLHGTVRQWSDQGVLLGTSEHTHGTGVYRVWYEDGNLQIEISRVNGQDTGRQRIYWDEGELLEESYWIRNSRVSKKKYLQACERDPTLPKYEDEAPSARTSPRNTRTRSRKSTPGKEKKTPPVDAVDEPARPTDDDLRLDEMLVSPAAVEARQWLRDGVEGDRRTLGELATTKESLRLVEGLYKAGAERVTAVEIGAYPEGCENTGKLVVTAPVDPTSRARLFRAVGRLARAAGFNPDRDYGQRHLFLLLD